MSALLALLVLGQGPGGPADGCAVAGHHYEALALEEALRSADLALEEAPGAVRCLEVKALVLLASGRTEEAREALGVLFEVAPDYVIDDPSLSPSTMTFILGVKEEVRPLSASVSTGWIVRTSLRVDLRLEGGLRGAARIRYRAELGPTSHVQEGEVPLVGFAATATVSVPTTVVANRLAFKAEVLDEVGRVVLPFSSERLLPGRPAAPRAPPVAAAPVVEESSVPWWLWAAIGVVAAGAAAGAVVLSQPSLPDASGTAGRTKI